MMVKLKEKYALGVDGGGTKTSAAVADLSGKILLAQKGDMSNWHGVGEKGAKINLEKLLKPILKKYDIGAAAFGLAGLNTKTDFVVYEKIIKKILSPKISFRIFNDTKITLEALPNEKARLLIIAGTGSNIYGEYKGKSAKAGGWDFLVSDEGSAYDFGMKAIRAAIRSFDGRGEKTILEKLVLQKSGTKHMHDLISKIYAIWQKNPQEFKKYIASFASQVDAAYYTSNNIIGSFGQNTKIKFSHSSLIANYKDDGDRVAKRIIMDGAEELFLGACAVIGKLGMAQERICVGYVGSNFKAPLLKDLLSDKIKKIAPKAYFVDNVEPIRGAIKIALIILNDRGQKLVNRK